jgi:hypothetical protein
VKRYIPITLLLASAAILTVGLIRLFELRFEAGDVYPPYSSLRPDPLGAMAWYESLEHLSVVTVSRDFSAVNQLPNGEKTTYLHLGTSLNAFRAISEPTLNEIERFLASGGRLVITMSPESEASKPPPVTQERQKPKSVPYRDKWGLDFEVKTLTRVDDKYEPDPVFNVSALPVPKTLDWHSGIVFKNLSYDWNPIYMSGASPVMIQRGFGRGMVVIATDSYFVSNEAMLFDRHADLLAFFIGPNRNIIFDEAHLGVTESPGIATLLRRYRLHWVIASLVLVAILFIWKMSIPLMPARVAEQDRNYIAGKDTGSGIVNLLRRGIPAGNLLETCFNEWKKSAAQTGGYSPARIAQAEAAFRSQTSGAAKDADVVDAYRTISRALQTRTHEH